MTKIIFLSMALLFTPLLNYSMASGIAQVSHSERQGIVNNLLPANDHTMSDMQQNQHYPNSHSTNKDKCSHQINDQCNISCCGNLVFISTTNPVLIKTSLHPVYFDVFKRLAASINLDNLLRPPKDYLI